MKKKGRGLNLISMQTTVSEIKLTTILTTVSEYNQQQLVQLVATVNSMWH